MKKWCLFLLTYFCVCLLAACAGAESPAAGEPAPGGTPSDEPQTGGETTESGMVTDI